MLRILELIGTVRQSWIAGVARALKGSKGEWHVCSICNASFEDKAELGIHTGKEHQGRGT